MLVSNPNQRVSHIPGLCIIWLHSKKEMSSCCKSHASPPHINFLETFLQGYSVPNKYYSHTLNWDDVSFQLSHQPTVYVLYHFLSSKRTLVLLTQGFRLFIWNQLKFDNFSNSNSLNSILFLSNSKCRELFQISNNPIEILGH